jgi:hypothetical protein
MHRIPSHAIASKIRMGNEGTESPTGFWVPVRPHPQARPNYCDENVALQIKQFGGQAICVWEVTENREDQFLEGTAHFIWRAPSGEYLDVSPSLINAAKHFVIPSAQSFQRPFPGNRFIPLSNDPTTIRNVHILEIAHAALAPNRRPGINVPISRDIVRLWIQDYCDLDKMYDRGIREEIFEAAWSLILRHRTH